MKRRRDEGLGLRGKERKRIRGQNEEQIEKQTLRAGRTLPLGFFDLGVDARIILEWIVKKIGLDLDCIHLAFESASTWGIHFYYRRKFK
jgi:hypothetical protein